MGKVDFLIDAFNPVYLDEVAQRVADYLKEGKYKFSKKNVKTFLSIIPEYNKVIYQLKQDASKWVNLVYDRVLERYQ